MKKKTLTLAIVVLFAIELFAQWTNNTQLNTLICDTTGEQVISKLSLNHQTGSGFISWFSNMEDFQYDVYMNRIDKDGNLLWDTEGLLISNNPTDTWVTDYCMIIDDDNCAVLTNQDKRTGTSNVFAYRISADGEFLWGDQGLQLTDNTCFNPSPALVQDNNGDYLIGWSKDSVVTTPTDTTEYSYILYQKVKKDMSFPWGDPKFIKNDTIDYMFLNFNFVLKPDNGFYLAFIGIYKPDTIMPGNYPYMNIYVQNFDQNGEVIWDAPVALEPDHYLSEDFYIYGDSYYQKDGGVIVVWQSADEDGATVKMQHLDSDGIKQCDEWGTTVSNNPYHTQEDFGSAYDFDNDLTYVFWQDLYYCPSQLTDCSAILGQKFASDGARQWSDTGLVAMPYICSPDTGQWVCGVSTHPDGGALAFNTKEYYSIVGPDTLTMSILSACRLDQDGEFVWNQEHITVCDAISPKGYFTLSDYTNGEWIATWSDGRKEPTVELLVSGIYAQNIKEDGTLGPLFITNPGITNKNKLSVYPNPFESETRISFYLSMTDNVDLALYDNTGSLVKRISPGLFRKGSNVIKINDAGLSSGIYHIVLNTANTVITDKVIVY